MAETTTSKLLDAWKTKRNIESDAAAALALGAAKNTVSQWRNGLRHANAAMAARMAKDIGLDELRVLAAIEADRTKGDDQRIWARHGKSAFMALLVGFTVCLPSTGRADPVRQQLGAEGQSLTLQTIMRN